MKLPGLIVICIQKKQPSLSLYLSLSHSNSILVWSDESSSENRIFSKLAVISTSSREGERTCSIKEIPTQLYANNGKISRKYQKRTKGTNIETGSYFMISSVDFRTRTGPYLTFSLWIYRQKPAILRTFEKFRIFATFKWHVWHLFCFYLS